MKGKCVYCKSKDLLDNKYKHDSGTYCDFCAAWGKANGKCTKCNKKIKNPNLIWNRLLIRLGLFDRTKYLHGYECDGKYDHGVNKLYCKKCASLLR